MDPSKDKKTGGEDKNDKTLSAVNYDSIHEVQHLEQASGDGGEAKVEDDIETKKLTKETEKEHAREDKAKSSWRGARPAAFFGVLVMSVGIAGTIILSPSLMLVNMKEVLVNDLNDSYGAYYTFTKKVLASQIDGAGCADDSIRCKFQTMSPMLKERFEDHGVRVTGTQNQGNQRYTVGSLAFPSGGTAMSDAQLQNIVEDSDDAQYRLDNVVWAKNGLFHDRKFEQRLFERFHIPQRPLVQGLEREAIDNTFDAALDRPEDFLDVNGQGVAGLDYLRDNGAAWAGRTYINLMLKPNNHMAIACGLYTYGNLADDALRRAKSVTLARFAMQFMSVADTIKSGNNATYEMVISALSDRLTYAGEDGTGTNAFDAKSYKVPALSHRDSSQRESVGIMTPADRGYMNDPTLTLLPMQFGAPTITGSDWLRQAPMVVETQAGSSRYEQCAEGMALQQSMSELFNECYTPGSYPVASHVGVAAGGMIQGQRQLIEDELCSITPNGFSVEELVRAAATAANYAAALKEVVELVKTAILTEAQARINITLPIAAGIEASRFDSRTAGEDAQDAIFAGTGILLGDAAQSIGMKPASMLELQMYLSETAPAYQSIARSDQISASKNQLDITNQHTFMGKMVRGWIGGTSEVTSLAGAASSVLGMLPRAATMMGTTSVSALYSQPLNFDPTRYIRTPLECGMAGNLPINPDFGCNLRYAMDPADLNRSISGVVNYMTQAHSGNAQESLSEVQGRDIGADPLEGARMQAEASQGAGEAYVDNSGKPNMNTEYGKFLRYCVDREYSWGTIGMVTPQIETPYTPDARDPFNPERRTYSGSEPTAQQRNRTATSLVGTYGIAWGSSIDQEWQTGEKCLESSDMLGNFRAYTAMCRVLAGMSGTYECWHEDASPTFKTGFYPRNDIIFVKEN